MLKKHMAALLVATAMAAAPALAQAPSGSTDRPMATGSGSTTSGSPAMQPGAAGSMSSGSGMSTGTSGSGAMSSGTGTSGSSTMGSGTSGTSTMSSGTSGSSMAGSMTQLQPNQVLASKLIGTTVVGSNNESIGDVNDVIMDRDGRAQAIVVGVGGFLGIGEKDVAIPFTQVEFTSRAATTTGTGTTSTTGTGTSSGNTNVTGSTTANGTAGTTGTARNDVGSPDRIMIRMSKQDLQNAPTFSVRGTAENNRATTGASGSTAPGTGTSGSTQRQ